MEKAILKTLIYADIFDYPLKINEIHKWLIGRKVTLRQVETALNKLYKVSSIKYRHGLFSPKVEKKGDYYFLRNRNELIVRKRRYREKQSEIYFRKAKMLLQILKIIPWIKLVGISGGLALSNASKRDDIDLFIITDRNRLWLSRLFTLGLLSLIGQRRKRADKAGKFAGKLCVNILLEEDNLEQKNKDIFIAHELLQMKVLWQRAGIYSKYLEDNQWAFEFLPNWIGQSVESSKYHVSREKEKSTKFSHDTLYIIHDIWNFFEVLAKKLQLWYMKSPKGLERIEKGALYFHPKDCRVEVLNRYKKRVSRLSFGTS